MVLTIKMALFKCLLDGGGKDWDELLPYVAMGYQMSKYKAMGYMKFHDLMFSKPHQGAPSKGARSSSHNHTTSSLLGLTGTDV